MVEKSSDSISDNWRKWTNYVLFVVAMAACTGFLTLYMSSIKESISSVKETMVRNDESTASKLDKVAAKTDSLCATVAEHSILLHQSYDQRMDYYRGYNGNKPSSKER